MDPTSALASSSQAPLTVAQQAQLKKLHDAATQLEGVFLGMMLKAMHPDDDDKTIFGPPDNAEKTWNEMLDEKRADAMAQTGQLGIAKMVEDQLRASVLGIQPGVPPTVEK